MAIPLRKSNDGNGPPHWQWRQARFWSLTTWLIVINVAVFVVDLVLGQTLDDIGHFSVLTAIYRFQIWRFVSFQFLHTGIEHLFFNMLSLYYFGQFVESFLGRWRYLAFYLICGIAGAVTYMLLWRMRFLVEGPAVRLVGASAGIFGVLVATAIIAPRMQVKLIFPPITLTMRTLAMIFIGVAVLTIVAGKWNAGGQAAHLGGAAMGAILIHHPNWLAVFTKRKKASRFWRPGDPASKFFR